MAQPEKIYEFSLKHPLTAARRKALDKYLKQHATRARWRITFAWDEANDHLLHVTTAPVRWDFLFTAKKLTVNGHIPFLARMLFTDAKRTEMRSGIQHILESTGFLG